MMDPQRKQTLASFITAAKAVIYNTKRMQGLLPMMSTPDGAIQAVQTIVGAIEQKKPVPPDIAPLLGVNIYMLMVDMAHKVTGENPDPGIVKTVIGRILAAMNQSHRTKPAAPPPAGIIGQQKAMA